MLNSEHQNYQNLDETSLPDTEEQEKVFPPLAKLIESTNIAEGLDEELLDKIGNTVYDGYRLDLESKSAWDQQVDEWVKLAAQVVTVRNWPWNKASNVKYPLLAIAAMQFAARAYPSLVPPDGKIVQFRVIGSDPDGKKAATADKLAKHMNYQLLEDMTDWEEEMDRMLIQLPIVGCMFKKTYFDPIRRHNVSRLVGPKDLVVNYWATSLEAAYRKTEIIPMTKNQVRSYQLAGVFRDIELPDVQTNPELPTKSDSHGNVPPSAVDESTPFVILEQHTFWDLDEDGYAEPYIITIEQQSKKVLRIVARFDSTGVVTNEKNKVVYIEPVEYYTKYGFIPNPDGGFYDIGFGRLLGPINKSVNTIINQLIDAGTLANLQSGFIGKGIRLQMGEMHLQPGQWMHVNSTGDDLRKQIFPLPVKEPSDVLFKLLGLLIESGRELASVAEIFTGKMPGQNTPATTTQATIEQGMKVFTAIYKRTYRALTKEFKKIFRLNSIYDENIEKAKIILDEPISRYDYDPKRYDVCPTADPTAASATQKLMKAEMLMQVLPLGLNMDEVKRRVLEAQEQPNIQALLTDQSGQPTQPPPDPKLMESQMKLQAKAEEHKMDMALKQLQIQMEQQRMLMEQKFMEMEKLIELRLKELEVSQRVRHEAMRHRMKLRQDMEKAYVTRRIQRMDAASGNTSGNGRNPTTDSGSKG